MTSRSDRRFCSTSCRVRAWELANPAPEYRQPGKPGYWEGIPLHWHLPTLTTLVGDYHAGYWRGPEGCPPTCPGLTPPHTRSMAIPEGQEGLMPFDVEPVKHLAGGF